MLRKRRARRSASGTLITPLIPLNWLAMLAVEKWRPARAFPPRKGWSRLGAAFLVLIGTIATVLPLLFDLEWVAA